MPRATPVEVRTAGKKERRYRAGALEVRTGRGHYGLWFRKRTGRFLALLNVLDRVYPAPRFERICGVADNDKIHQAAAVRHGRRPPPRLALLFLPTYGPRANPLERCFGDRHDKVPGTIGVNGGGTW